MKNKRQSEILKIIKEYSIGTHDGLIEELKKRGITVTQATVSRDIKDLRLVKIPSPNGPVYAASPDGAGAENGLFQKSVKSVKSALHTVVVRTYPGMAGGVGAAVDELMESRMLGTIAGDDTVLVITESEIAAKELCNNIINLFDCKGEEDA